MSPGGCPLESSMLREAIRGDKVPLVKEGIDRTKFNKAPNLPFNLRLQDFEIAMQDVYDFF